MLCNVSANRKSTGADTEGEDALLWEVDLVKGRELEFSVECEVPGNLQVKM